MSDQFFRNPILNSPYAYPARHWELDESGQPTRRIIGSRRPADFITPIPKPRKRKGAIAEQASLVFNEGKGLSTTDKLCSHTLSIDGVHLEVDRWRQLPQSRRRVTAAMARLLNQSMPTPGAASNRDTSPSTNPPTTSTRSR